MQTTSIQTSPMKDGRRILGEKDTNACFSPVHQNKQSILVGTPTKRALFAPVSPKKLLPSPIFAGQKRSRDQVEETELNNAPPATRGEENFNSTDTQDTQQTNRGKDALDRVAAPSSSSERDQRQQETKQNPPSVAGSAVQASRKVPEDFHARKIFIQEKAALLRNTLQTAMQSVTDHQIDRRVSDLEEHSRKVPRITPSSFSSPLPALSFRKPTTPQFHTPRLGSMLDMSSTPTQQTPDLPRRYSPIKHTSVKLQSTPLPEGGSPMQLSSPPATVIHHGNDESSDRMEQDRKETSEGAFSFAKRRCC
ncbi:hypothetical protein N7468_004582 [Penicillium chermesinum]|uniref:Uncharacterized protein n=1 Tax=Penicillium chermesinum TaxID=63820 RepID=A0A9W9TTC4_9EURO|nr:uncharacterized protein N7468_004582 [Penicillium chermesinum]KAJ5239963.1 hypothetical protein N7468_004582 [Penicillium chermesinum]